MPQPVKQRPGVSSSIVFVLERSSCDRSFWKLEIFWGHEHIQIFCDLFHELVVAVHLADVLSVIWVHLRHFLGPPVSCVSPFSCLVLDVKIAEFGARVLLGYALLLDGRLLKAH